MQVKSEISAVIATFANPRHAGQFVNELKRAGFKDDEIEVHYPQGSEAGVLENYSRKEQKFLAGRTFVVVEALCRGGEAVAILRRCEKLHALSQPPAATTKRSFFRKLWRRSSASDYRTEGEACLAHGEYDEAIADFDKAIHLDPQNMTAYLDRGLAYEEEGQYQEAISDYDVAIRLDPNHALAHFYRGNAWFALDYFDQAIHDYTEAIRLDPSLALAYYQRGFAHREKGHSERAKADQEEALRLDPELAELESSSVGACDLWG
jgi:tetratricopeptide (TPR) repeat protein